ncbi:MAG: B12-binding domain-containing radical SAM protein [Paraclostridium sp.]
MKLLLIYPPLSDFTEPSLGMPLLSSYITNFSNHNTSQLDSNIEVFDQMLTKKVLQESIDHIENLPNNEEAKNILNKSFIYRKLPMYIDSAKSILKNKKYFFEHSKYIFAMNVIKLSINLLNLSFENFSISSSFNIEFLNDTIKYDKSIEDLNKCIKYFENAKFNPLRDILDDVINKKIKKENPDVIGISNIYYMQDFFSIYIIRYIKRNFPKIKIILGGSSVIDRFNMINVNDRLIHNEYFHSVDFFIVHEGEIAITKLLDYLDSSINTNLRLNEIENLIYFDKNLDIFIRNKINWVSDLDQIPPPEFDKHILEKYFTPEIVLPLAPTRGCYWGKCTFCTYGFNYKDRKYREMTPEKLTKDLTYLKNKFNVSNFTFTCDSISHKAAESYAKSIINSNLNISWMSDFRLENVLNKEDRIKILRKSGLRLMNFGVESYSNKVLEYMKKGIKNTYFTTTIRTLHENDIAVDLMMFNKFPTETVVDYKETLNFLIENKDSIHVKSTIGKFNLIRNCYVANNPSEFNISISDSNNKNSLFLSNVIPYINYNKQDYDTEDIEELEELAFGDNYMGDRPWVNGNQNTHTLLYVKYLGKESLKEINDFYTTIKFITLNYYNTCQ